MKSRRHRTRKPAWQKKKAREIDDEEGERSTASSSSPSVVDAYETDTDVNEVGPGSTGQRDDRGVFDEEDHGGGLAVDEGLVVFALQRQGLFVVEQAEVLDGDRRFGGHVWRIGWA